MPYLRPVRGSLARTSDIRRLLAVPETRPKKSKSGASKWAKSTFGSAFFRLPYEENTRLIGFACAPQLECLKRAKAVENSGKSDPPIGFLGPNHDQTPSQFLFGGDFPEVNRTLTAVLMFVAVAKGDYERFSNQDPNAKVPPLTRKSFNKLRRNVFRRIRSPACVWAVIVTLITNDLGKDPELNAKICGFLGRLVNHDEVLEEAVKRELDEVDIILDLPKWVFRAVELGIRIGSRLNFAQTAQLENIAASLDVLDLMLGHHLAFFLKAFELTFDVSGARGHINATCALVFSEAVFHSYDNVIRVLWTSVNRNVRSSRETYRTVVQTKVDYLERLPGCTRKFNIDDEADFALLRLSAMGRVSTSERLLLFEGALKALDAATKTLLIRILNNTGLDNETAMINYYLPAVIALVERKTKDDPYVTLQALTALFRLTTRTFSDIPKTFRRGSLVECEMLFVVKEIEASEKSVLLTLLDLCKQPTPREAYSCSMKPTPAR